MFTFLLSVVALFAGYLIYGRFVEKVFAINYLAAELTRYCAKQFFSKQSFGELTPERLEILICAIPGKNKA